MDQYEINNNLMTAIRPTLQLLWDNNHPLHCANANETTGVQDLLPSFEHYCDEEFWVLQQLNIQDEDTAIKWIEAHQPIETIFDALDEASQELKRGTYIMAKVKVRQALRGDNNE